MRRELDSFLFYYVIFTSILEREIKKSKFALTHLETLTEKISCGFFILFLFFLFLLTFKRTFMLA